MKFVIHITYQFLFNEVPLRKLITFYLLGFNEKQQNCKNSY